MVDSHAIRWPTLILLALWLALVAILLLPSCGSGTRNLERPLVMP